MYIPISQLLFKLGKFYEIFDCDAEICKSTLGLAQIGNASNRSHCRFPEQSFNKYNEILVSSGHCTVVVEQMERVQDKARASAPIQRKLVAGYTPGTQRSISDIESVSNDTSYLVAITELQLHNQSINSTINVYEFGICILNLSIGSFCVGSFSDNTTCDNLSTVLSTIQPVELLYNHMNISSDTLQAIKMCAPSSCMYQPMYPAHIDNMNDYECNVRICGGVYPTQYIKNKLMNVYYIPTDDPTNPYINYPASLAQLLINNNNSAIDAFGLVLSWIEHDNAAACMALQNFTTFDFNSNSINSIIAGNGTAMVLDRHTIMNLEILENDEGGDAGNVISYVFYSNQSNASMLILTHT